MRWKWQAIAAFALVIAAVSVVAMMRNPLRKSDDEIRAWLLTSTPIGTSRAEIVSMFEQHGWPLDAWQTTIPRPATSPFLGATVGSYTGFPEWFPWTVNVRAFWEFGTDDRVTDIRIMKQIDSP